MTAHGPERGLGSTTREVLVLSRAARVALLLAALVAVAAGVVWWLPVERVTPPAPPVPCGTAARPVTAQPAADLCGALAQRDRVLAAGLLVAAAVLAVGGPLAFGTDRRTQVAAEASARPASDETP
jgi:hypothetical protein